MKEKKGEGRTEEKKKRPKDQPGSA